MVYGDNAVINCEPHHLGLTFPPGSLSPDFPDHGLWEEHDRPHAPGGNLPSTLLFSEVPPFSLLTILGTDYLKSKLICELALDFQGSHMVIKLLLLGESKRAFGPYLFLSSLSAMSLSKVVIFLNITVDKVDKRLALASMQT